MKFSLFRLIRTFLFLGIFGASGLAQAQVLLDIRQEDPELPLLAGEQNTFEIFAQGMTVGLAEVSVLVDGEVLAEAIQTGISEWMAFGVVFDAVGTWDLVVRAIDEEGAMWNSNPVSFEVGYAPPEVRILAPLEGTQHPVGTILPVQLAAYDGFGLITDIELWLNDQRILNYFWNESDLEWVAESAAGANYPDPNTFEPSEKPFRASVQLLSAGRYKLEARVTSTSGLSSISEPRFLEAEDPELGPVLNMVFPVTGSQYLPGTNLPVQVEGFDPGSLIEQVEYLLNGVVIDTAVEQPFRTNVQLPSVGQYRLQARALTTFGQFAYSQEVLLSTGPQDGVTPRVVLDFPLPLGAGDTVNDVSLASEMYFNAAVVDPDGGVINDVQFYINGQLVGSAEDQVGDTYSLGYKPAAQGSYILSASATDDSGRVGWSLPLVLEVGPLERPLPEASIVGENLSGIAGRELTLEVDADGGLIDIDRVDLLLDGVYLGSVLEPDEDGLYRFNWVPDEAGEYRIEARVVQIDPADSTWDNWVITDPVSLSIAAPVGKLPSVFLESPSDAGPFVIGSTVMLVAQAYDPEGEIEEVNIYSNGEWLATLADAPYFYPYTFEFAGQHALQSTVVDGDGNVVGSNIILLEASQRVLSDGSVLRMAVPLSLKVGEPTQFAVSTVGSVLQAGRIGVYGNGQLLVESLESPHLLNWTPGLIGEISLFASAEFPFADGSVLVLSTPVTVREVVTGGDGGGFEDPPPIVERFSSNVPAGWARLGQTIVWELEASDDDAVVSIEVLRNGEVIPTVSVLPLEVEDVIEDMGLFRYVMRVRDTAGNVTESAVREIRATRGTAPVAMFTDPDLPTSLYSESDPIVVEAMAFAADEPANIPGGQVAQVEFFLNGDFLAADLTQPYLQEMDPSIFLSGTNTLVAVAVSDTGLRSVPAVHEIELIEGSLPVINSLLVKTDGLKGLPGTVVTIEADAVDTTGISRVELLLFGQVLDSVSESPYSFEVSLETVGSYGFSVRAVNVDGHAVESAVETVEVVHPQPLVSERDFVYQVFHDLLFRAPSETELASYSSELLEGTLTRERLVAGLLGVGESNANTAEYAATRQALLGLSFAAERWPTRLELQDAVMEVLAGGIDTVVARRMPAYEAAYQAETGFTVPDILSPMEEIGSFVGWLFREKYGFEPTANQLELAIWHFRASGRDAYTADFLSDNTLIALPQGWATSVLGFQFLTPNPPYNALLEEVEAASLLINLLRIVPSPSEVEGYAGLLTVSQIASIVADSRYAARFESTFSSIEVHREGWLRSDWFGWFNPLQEPWVFHNEQGWVAFRTSGQSEFNLWYYDPSFGWMWTQSGLYPYLFDASGQRWLWNWRKPFVGGERLYLDLTSMEWISK